MSLDDSSTHSFIAAPGSPAQDTAAEPMTAPGGIVTITGIFDGYRNYQVLLTGFKSGLFDWLDAQPDGAERAQISQALGLRGQHVSGLLQAMQDVGLLEREGNRYRLAAGMRAVLCTSSPWCQAEAAARLAGSGHGWADLHRFMCDGWTHAAPPPVGSPQRHPFWGEVNGLLEHLAARPASAQALAAARTLVVFDASAGLCAAALARRWPQLETTVVVAPGQAATAAVHWQTLGLTRAQTVVEGDLLQAPLDAQFDCAIVFHALYPLRKSTDAALARLSALTAPGGEACLMHWFCLEACETAPGGLRDLDRAVLLDYHPMCGIERFGARLSQAGLVFSERLDIHGDYGTTKLHLARKPAA